MNPTCTEFATLSCPLPDLNALQSALRSLQADFCAAESDEDRDEVIYRWNGLRAQFETAASLAYLRYTQNVNDPEARTAKEFFDNNSPSVSEWMNDFCSLLISSRHRPRLERTWGALFFRRMDQREQTFSAAIKPALVEQSRLEERYTDMLSNARVPLGASKYNLSELSRFCNDSDRELREQAARAKFTFFQSCASTLDDIFHRLVSSRHAMARRLGFRNYTDYRYLVLGRSDYGPCEIAGFRRQVRRHIVPIVAQMREQQRRRLGYARLYFYDESTQFPEGNPRPQGDSAWIVQRAGEMFSVMEPELGAFFRCMEQSGYMDLVARRGKAGGGYCTKFPSIGMPFIFSNFNGTAGDVEVLIHETGHAFQAYKSRHHRLVDYLSPTLDACEIHSMALEFLSWPWMENFFGGSAERFRFCHLQRALNFLPYACAVDEFQHWVYEHPEATPSERKRQWQTVEQRYLPWRDYNGVEFCEEGGLWQRQMHIYRQPFYYIDYALAQTCALQFKARAENDRRQAMVDYLRICALGGSRTFLEILREGNLLSPFRPDCLKALAGNVQQWLESCRSLALAEH